MQHSPTPPPPHAGGGVGRVALTLAMLCLMLSAPGAGGDTRQCLESLDGLAPGQRVSPARLCPGLLADIQGTFDGGPAFEEGKGMVPAAELESLVRSLQPAATERVTVDADRVSRLVDEARVDRVPGWLERLREWLAQHEPDPQAEMGWLRGLWDWLVANSAWLLPVFEGLLAVVALILIAWIVTGLEWPAWRWPRRRREAARDEDAVAGRGPTLTWETINALEPARQVPALLAWLVAEWERTGRVPGAARLTDGQLLARLTPQSAAAHFAELARAAEAALYGARVPGEAQRRRCFELARELHPTGADG